MLRIITQTTIFSNSSKPCLTSQIQAMPPSITNTYSSSMDIITSRTLTSRLEQAWKPLKFQGATIQIICISTTRNNKVSSNSTSQCECQTKWLANCGPCTSRVDSHRTPITGAGTRSSSLVEEQMTAPITSDRLQLLFKNGLLRIRGTLKSTSEVIAIIHSRISF